MSSRRKIIEDPCGIGKYQLMNSTLLPSRGDVLRHYLYLRAFKYSNATPSYVLCQEVYNKICIIYQSASIPVTKSKDRIIEQIKELESKRKDVNKKKNPNRIADFNNYLKEIFAVVKSLSDIPLPEREFYSDQCNTRKMMISASIDKIQTARIIRNAKIKHRSVEEIPSTSTAQQLDDTDSHSTSSATESESSITSLDSDKDRIADSSNPTSSYFMIPLPNTADVAAQINIGEEQVAKLLTAYNKDTGSNQVVTRKKVRAQREKARKQRVSEISQNILFLYGKQKIRL